jgi:hypothetical protein
MRAVCPEPKPGVTTSTGTTTVQGTTPDRSLHHSGAAERVGVVAGRVAGQ